MLLPNIYHFLFESVFKKCNIILVVIHFILMKSRTRKITTVKIQLRPKNMC